MKQFTDKDLQELKDSRELLSPPGDTIKDTIETMGVGRQEVAVALKMSLEDVDRLLSGEMAITQAIAEGLEEVLLVPSVFWLNREFVYRRELWKIVKQEMAYNRGYQDGIDGKPNALK